MRLRNDIKRELPPRKGWQLHSLSFLRLQIVVKLRDICCSLTLTQEVLREVVGHTPEEVLVHITEAVTLTRKQQHIEALIRANQRIHNAESTARVYVLVDIAVYEQQVTLKARCKLVVSRDVILKDSLAILLHLADTVMLLAPPAVVDIVIVVTCARYRYVEEVRVHQNRCGRHKATT